MSPAVTGMRGLSMRLAPTTIRLPVVSLCRTVGCGSSSATMIRPRELAGASELGAIVTVDRETSCILTVKFLGRKPV